MSKGDFSITKKIGGNIPALPLRAIKDEILGPDYSLSIAYVGEKKSRELNRLYRGHDKSTNILSFPLSETEGEIIICPAVARREAKTGSTPDGKNLREWLGFLVIHGMLHLIGYEHSSRMERAEAKYDKKYFYRDRLGNHPDARGSGRVPKGRKKS